MVAMGVADRMRRRQVGKEAREGVSLPDSTGDGQTLARVDNATVKRVKGVMYTLREIIETNPAASGMSKMALVILPALADEMCAEMEDLDEMTIRIIMAQIGEIIAWIGHGDNTRLPDSLRDFAEGIQPGDTTANRDDSGRDGRNELSTNPQWEYVAKTAELAGGTVDMPIVEAEIVE